MNLTFRQFLLKESELMIDWLTSDTWPYHIHSHLNRESVRKWIAEGKFTGKKNRTFWVILNGKERVGVVHLYNFPSTNPIIDLRISSSYRVEEIGKQALVWSTDYIFRTNQKAEGIECDMRQDNIAMRQLFSQCGYIKEGHWRKSWPTEENTYLDAVGYGILREDWEQKKITPVNWNDEDFEKIDYIRQCISQSYDERGVNAQNLTFQQFLPQEAELMVDWLLSDTWPYHTYPNLGRKQVREWVKSGKFMGEDKLTFWVILNGKEIIGMIRLFELLDPLPHAPQIDIRIRDPYRGKGFGKRALVWLTNHFFTTTPEGRRIEGITRFDNFAMRKVFCQCGYVKEAYCRNLHFTHIGYGILKEDWEHKKITPVNWYDEDF